MKKVEIGEVKRLASLSALEFSEEELIGFVPEFENILALVDEVKNCNVENVEFQHKSHKLCELREDVAGESLPQEEILKNSPKTKKGSFCVPKMLD